MEPVYVPRLLDEKDRILIFSLYELLAFVGGFGLGIVFRMPVLGIGFGIVALLFSRWMKRNGYMDTFINVLYWHISEKGMSILRFKLEGTPRSAYRQMTG